MIVFIDDSGDPGFKFDKGSSSHFVIAMVIFEDALEAEKTAIAIKSLRRELRFPDDAEFKFFRSSDVVKRRFLECVTPFSFRIRALVVDKSKIRSGELRTDKRSFYAYFIKTALKHNGGEILEAKIRVDGSGDKVFRREFMTYLRRELNLVSGRRIVANVRLEDSKSNVLIQLADMVAGAILRKYAKGEDAYRQIISGKVSDEWQFR